MAFNLVLLGIGIVGIGGGGYLYYLSRKDEEEAAMISRASQEIVEGKPAKISGAVSCSNPITAANSGRKCVYCRTVDYVQEYRRGSSSRVSSPYDVRASST